MNPKSDASPEGEGIETTVLSRVDEHGSSQMHRPILRALKPTPVPSRVNLVMSDASPDIEGIETTQVWR